MTGRSSGISRFASDLPKVDRFVTLGEGNTPLVPLDKLAHELGVAKLSAKLEFTNPTGSYKDRVAAMSISLAVQRGRRGWVATSSGNAGLAMAAYGTRAALPGFLCMVANAPSHKWLPLTPYPVGLISVEGTGHNGSSSVSTRMLAQIERAADEYDLFLAITAHVFNPDGMRGVDTIGYELAEQTTDPTCVYVPTGGGGLISAVSRGLFSRDMPVAVIACQPAGCAPIVHYVRNEIDTPQIESCLSQISGLQLPDPPDGYLAAEAIRESWGWGTSATDHEILAAQQRLAATEGISVEPAAAAGLAALINDIDSGMVGDEDHPILILTGAGWKDPQRPRHSSQQCPMVKVKDIENYIETWQRHI
ncbi:pyridoxal-phosphate dependent enzyme [Actinobacteria bacterium YIM 96077]|uniref:Tryptophan synthase beta chain-like PALP domain-containing protein n=1 Tax=Phytoactinopolyspora halophila TaxID=1981511 RepID=A0A329QKS9_9ACTN|nr:pyridoxal-phosphate dependent enzyme [Phytoactinopolyspora halophila]AYY12409.1 pyridoxal-phosphate dependent enzyme [Actinobacteria bacterium YIM 96077]RAW12012.1 hypothetical protein DPM12_15170 [Phytoactinopolyspora halophila]